MTHTSGSPPTAPQCVFRAGIRWELLPEFGPLLDDVLAGQAEIVKSSPNRLVTRHSIEGRTFYVKHYLHHARWFLPLKYLFKPPRSKLEWTVAPQLAAQGVPIVPHLAHGERWNWRGLQESILVTEGPEGFAPLKSLEMANEVEQSLGRLLRRLHDLGISHTDFHPANILYSSATGRLCLIDLDNISFLPELTVDRRLRDFTVLHLSSPIGDPFFGGYGTEFARHKGKVISLASRRRQGRIRKHLELIFERRKFFEPKTINGLRWFVRSQSFNEQLERILEDPDGFLATRARMLKAGSRTTVGAGFGVVVKRYNLKKRRNLLYDLFRRSRARSCFVIARHLELLNIPTASPLAVMDQRKFGFKIRGYFVMEEIRGATFLWETGAARSYVLSQLAWLIARLHHEGFSHRDLKETNILANAEGVPHLIDLDGMRFLGKVPDRLAVAQLARLELGFSRRTQISLRERVCFLKFYCGARDIADWRWWWNQIGKKNNALRMARSCGFPPNRTQTKAGSI